MTTELLERGIIDPLSEGASNRPLEITGSMTPNPEGHGIFLKEWRFPRPETTPTEASSRDTEGKKRFGRPSYDSRLIPVTVWIAEETGIAAATNLITNPSFELATTTWETTGTYLTSGATLAVSSAKRLAGESSGLVTLGAASTSKGIAFPVTLVSGQTYTASVWIRGAVGGEPVQLILGTAAGTASQTTAATLTTEWQRVTVTWTATATTGRLAIRSGTAAGASSFNVDAVQVELGAAVSAYFDGDTPGCDWTGATHGTTSTRRGTGADTKRFLQCVYDLQEKLQDVDDAGKGTLKRYFSDGTFETLDLTGAKFTGEWSKTMAQGRGEFSFELEAAPAARLVPVTFPLRTETAKQVLSGTEGPILGNMPALGDLALNEIQSGGAQRNFVAVSLQMEDLDTGANGDVFYEAEGRTALSGAGVGNTPGTAANTHGGATNSVVTATLTQTYVPYLSTRATGAGAYLTHVGPQVIWARVWRPAANTGAVSLRVEYAQGDLVRFAQLPAVAFAANDREGAWVWVKLGTVKLRKPKSGAHRWDGRILAKSTVAGDSLSIDAIAIFAAGEFYAEIRAGVSPPTAVGTTIARDDFAQTAGALAGKQAPLPAGAPGVWSGAGDADDFQVSGSGAISRPLSAVDSAETNGRYARLGTLTQAAVAIETLMYADAMGGTERRGLLARYVDTSNWLMGYVLKLSGWPKALVVSKRVVGTETVLGVVFTDSLVGFLKLQLSCLADGSGSFVAVSGSAQIASLTWGADANLATGGALATGGFGVYQAVPVFPVAGTPTVGFDSISVQALTAPTPDAVIYPGRSMQVRHDGYRRQSIDAAVTSDDVGIYEGDRLFVPDSGRTGRSLRWAALALRDDPDTSTDSAIDDLSGQFTYTPRVIEIAEPS